MPTFGSLFAGIGGIDLGLERAGWECRFQVEWDPYCQHVLAHHWPDVPRVGDIADAHAASVAHPDPLGRDRGTGPLGQGRRAESQDGGPIAPADPDGERLALERQQEPPRIEGAHGSQPDGRHCEGCLPPVDLLAGGFPCQPFSNAGKRLGTDDERWLWPQFARLVGELRPSYVLVENVPGLLAGHGGMGDVLGDLATLGYDAEWDSIPAAAVGAPHLRYRVWIVAYSHQSRLEGWDVGRERAGQRLAWPRGGAHAGDWSAEPDVGRVAHGVPARVDRLRALGNAVVPQVVEVIGRRILEMER